MLARAHRARANRGFTLIEILIAIAIIAVLAGLLLVVAGPIRERARQSTCVSNLQQIGMAFAIYRQDYDGREPTQGVPMLAADLGLPVNNPEYFIDHYIRNRGVLFCPDYRGEHGLPPGPGVRGGTFLSYWWDMAEIDHAPLRFHFSQVVALRGDQAPVLDCTEHFVQDFLAPRWQLNRVIVLRLNGEVSSELEPNNTAWPEW